MKRSIIILSLLASLSLSSGCSHLLFWKKPNPAEVKEKVKQDPHVATATELEFKARWVEKRSAELISQGVSPVDAKSQASTEFAVKFSATHSAQ
ncbi:MAG: hypothetical protein DVB35_02615 [Verrucomicrobia bacterium]|jgi:hypothetical protein|nr:MAG: hypothetical protein DVB35_02615 [Verrucomicrobiota bacterium]